MGEGGRERERGGGGRERERVREGGEGEGGRIKEKGRDGEKESACVTIVYFQTGTMRGSVTVVVPGKRFSKNLYRAAADLRWPGIRSTIMVKYFWGAVSGSPWGLSGSA